MTDAQHTPETASEEVPPVGPRQMFIPNATCLVCSRSAPPVGRQICATCFTPYPARPEGVQDLLLPLAPTTAYEIPARRSIRCTTPKRTHQLPLKAPISSTKPKSMGKKNISKHAREATNKVVAKVVRQLKRSGRWDPTPRDWTECDPRECPWCLKPVTMDIVAWTSGRKQANVRCPKCKGRVRYQRGAGTAWSWEKFEREDQLAMALDERREYSRALNHCNPCPHIACRHHNYLEEDKVTGAVKLNFPGRDPDEIGETCSLREANKGGHTIRAVGQCLNIVTERTREILIASLARLTRGMRAGDDIGTDETDLESMAAMDLESGDGGSDVIEDDADSVEAAGEMEEGTD